MKHFTCCHYQDYLCLLRTIIGVKFFTAPNEEDLSESENKLIQIANVEKNTEQVNEFRACFSIHAQFSIMNHNDAFK